MDADPAKPRRPPRRRRRLALSCLECRRRKVRCDRAEPCARCAATRAQCSYGPYGGGELPAAGDDDDDPAHARPQRLQQQQRPPAEALGGFVFGAGGDGSSTAVRAFGGGGTETELLQRVRRLEEASAAGCSSSSSEAMYASQNGLQEARVDLNKTRVVRWSLWMGRAPEFSDIVACFGEASGACSERWSDGEETRELVVQMGELLDKCKRIARALKTGRPSRTLSHSGVGLTMPSREVSDQMAALYFQYFESAFRILHAPSFWAEYCQYWEHPESAALGTRIKILLVVGTGSSVHDGGDDDADLGIMVNECVYAAQTWLSGPLEKDRLDIAGLQIHCLAILARQVLSVGGDLVWISMGELVHKAMQVGLHRDPRHLPPMSVLSSELRRRLWASILEMLLQSSLESAMPPRISLDEFDTEAPSNNDDSEIDDSTTALVPHPRDVCTGASVQLLLLDSLPIRLKILQLLNSLRSEISYSDALALSSQVTAACQSTNRFLDGHSTSGASAFQRNLADYLVRRFLLPLHCPFATRARSNPLYHYSVKAGVEAALCIVSPPAPADAAFSRLVAGGGGCFREGLRDAATVVSLELLAQAEAQRLDGTLRRVPGYVGVLRSAVRGMVDLAAERIRRGETNVKMHMFLSMVLAQVEAKESGRAGCCKLDVARSARDSLAFCHDLVRGRADASALASTCDAASRAPSLDEWQHGNGLDFDLGLFFPDSA